MSCINFMHIEYVILNNNKSILYSKPDKNGLSLKLIAKFPIGFSIGEKYITVETLM